MLHLLDVAFFLPKIAENTEGPPFNFETINSIILTIQN
jgi:hypothetical protein